MRFWKVVLWVVEIRKIFEGVGLLIVYRVMFMIMVFSIVVFDFGSLYGKMWCCKMMLLVMRVFSFDFEFGLLFL